MIGKRRPHDQPNVPGGVLQTCVFTAASDF